MFCPPRTPKSLIGSAAFDENPRRHNRRAALVSTQGKIKGKHAGSKGDHSTISTPRRKMIIEINISVTRCTILPGLGMQNIQICKTIMAFRRFCIKKPRHLEAIFAKTCYPYYRSTPRPSLSCMQVCSANLSLFFHMFMLFRQPISQACGVRSWRGVVGVINLGQLAVACRMMVLFDFPQRESYGL